MRIYRGGIVFGLRPLETVLIPLLDGLQTIDRSKDRQKNSVLCVQRTKSSRVMIVDCLDQNAYYSEQLGKFVTIPQD